MGMESVACRKQNKFTDKKNNLTGSARNNNEYVDSATRKLGSLLSPNSGLEREMPVLKKEKDKLCGGCGGDIVDRYYLLAVEKQWHVSCLCCCECKLKLETQLSCFARDGNIYCKEDYRRRFSVDRCGRCGIGILANELVMKAKGIVYHINCFNCATCNKVLTTGDQFGMKDTMIYCKEHYESLLQSDQGLARIFFSGEASPNRSSSPTQGTQYYNGVGAVQKGRPRKKKTIDTDYNVQGYDSENQHSGLEGDYQQSQHRTKRMRTSFKHHQLRAMKSYFALNHNPDAKDLKQLAQKTGLTKRVLQVWFQNARAKYRRNIVKGQEQKQQTPQQLAEQQLASLETATSNTESSIMSDIENNTISIDSSPGLDFTSNDNATELHANMIDSSPLNENEEQNLAEIFS